MEEGANSTLSIARVGPADSGNYTCVLTTMPDQPATVHVHVLNGEGLKQKKIIYIQRPEAWLSFFFAPTHANATRLKTRQFRNTRFYLAAVEPMETFNMPFDVRRLKQNCCILRSRYCCPAVRSGFLPRGISH